MVGRWLGAGRPGFEKEWPHRAERATVRRNGLMPAVQAAVWWGVLSCLAPVGPARAAAQGFEIPKRNVENFQLLPDPAQPVRPSATGELPQTVRVQRFEIAGNRLLSTPELMELLSAWLGERKPLELSAAALAVQQRYRDAGYGGVVAYLPNQNVSSGVVRVEVLEGQIERINVSGQQQFSEAQIRGALSHLQAGQTPRLDLIDSQLQMLNENPARHARLLLRPGQSRGGVLAEVEVQEVALARANLKLDNSGAASTGRWRAALGGQYANLFGKDHVIAAELQTSVEHPSSLAVVSGNYRVPYYEQRLLMDVYAAWSDSNGGKTSTAAGDLQFSGKGQIAGVRLQKFLPRWGERDQRLIASLEQRQYLNQCSIEGLPDGACGSAGVSVMVQPLSLAYLLTGGSSAWRYSLQPSLHHNLAWGGAHADAASLAAAREGAQLRYSILRLQAAMQTALPKDWAASWRLSAQAADGALVPGEQLGLGGSQAVRGFEERELLGDSGLQLSLELSTPNLLAWASPPAAASATGAQTPAPHTQGDLRAVVFVDAGWVRNRGALPCLGSSPHCRAASAGLGLRWTQGRWQAQLDWAQALTEGMTTTKGAQRAHFNLQISY